MGEPECWTKLPNTSMLVHQFVGGGSSVGFKVFNDKGTMMSGHFDPFDLFGALDFAMLKEYASDRLADTLRRWNELTADITKYQNRSEREPDNLQWNTEKINECEAQLKAAQATYDYWTSVKNAMDHMHNVFAPEEVTQ